MADGAEIMAGYWSALHRWAQERWEDERAEMRGWCEDAWWAMWSDEWRPICLWLPSTVDQEALNEIGAHYAHEEEEE